MDAAIGRLHLTITVAEPVAEEVPAPKPACHRLERLFRRQEAERLAETDRSAWNAEFHKQGRLY